MTITLAEAVRMDLSLQEFPVDLDEPIELPETDGKPLDSPWHRDAIALLIESAHEALGPRENYFVGGNMCLYYDQEQAKNLAFLGPDFFYVNGVDGRKSRRVWTVWEEGGRYPNAIIELQSPSTANTDRTTKKDIYEKIFRTPEYFLYEPEMRRLSGWMLTGGEGGHYVALGRRRNGRIWSEQLRLFLGRWEGEYIGTHDVWLRMFHPDGSLVLTGAERAETERQRADAECQRAETERQRAEAAEAEIARLRALLGTSAAASGEASGTQASP